MKKTLWALSAMALIGCGLSACGEEGDVCYTNDAGVDIVCGDLLSGTIGKDYCVKSKTGKFVCSKNDHCCTDGNDETCDREFDDTGACVDKGGEITGCSTDNDCDKDTDQVCNTDTHQCEARTSAPTVFKFIRIDDASTDTAGEDPGADIDAVAVINGSDIKWATEVWDYVQGTSKKKYKKGATDNDVDTNNKTVSTNPLLALGNPDSFINYGKAENPEICQYYFEEKCKENNNCANKTFVSLGGAGGFLILEMGGEIKDGTKIDVLEVGGCSLKNCNDSGYDCGGSDSKPKKAVADGIKIYVSTTDSRSKDWKVIGEGASSEENKGVITFNVTQAQLDAGDAQLAE